MADKNRAQIIGVIDSIEHRSNNVSSLSVRTSMAYRDQATGTTKFKTEWHRVVAFNKLSEKLKALKAEKTSRISVEGSLRQNKWNDKEGKERKDTEIVASSLDLLFKPEVQEQKVVAQVQPQVQVTQQYNSGGYAEY